VILSVAAMIGGDSHDGSEKCARFRIGGRRSPQLDHFPGVLRNFGDGTAHTLREPCRNWKSLNRRLAGGPPCSEPPNILRTYRFRRPVASWSRIGERRETIANFFSPTLPFTRLEKILLCKYFWLEWVIPDCSKRCRNWLLRVHLPLRWPDLGGSVESRTQRGKTLIFPRRQTPTSGQRLEPPLPSKRRAWTACLLHIIGNLFQRVDIANCSSG